MAWKRELTLAALNASSENTMVAHLGIIYTRLEEGLLEAEMPVDARTHQPFGLLHGGASAALAETLGNTPSTVGRIYNTVYQRCKAQRDLIIDKFPKLNRFLLLFIGFVSVLLSFFMARVFMRMKLPGYLMG